MKSCVRRVVRSLAFYPVSFTYLGAVLVLLLVTRGVAQLDVGLVLLGMWSALAILLSMRREMGRVHTLVDAQQAKVATLQARIDQLLGALAAAGVPLPKEPDPDDQ